MDIGAWIEALRAQGIHLWTENGKLKVKAAEGLLDQQTIFRFKQDRDLLIEWLNREAEKHRHEITAHALSCSQQALWSLYRIAPRNVTFNLLFACRLPTDVQPRALQAACQLLLDRHPQLRAQFNESAEAPVQHISVHPPLQFKQHTLEHCDELSVNRALTRWAEEPFDLSIRPIRFGLFSTADTHTSEPVFAFVVHHIVADFWSCQLLLGELSIIYYSIVQQRNAVLPALRCAYTDFVSWQQSYRESRRYTEDERYWMHQLRGSLPELALPYDFPRPAIPSFQGDIYRVSLTLPLTASIKETAQRSGVTTTQWLMAAFIGFLHQVSNQRDILVGTPILSRPLPGAEWVVGDFSNPLVIRAQVNPFASFNDLLMQVRDTLLQAMHHQDYPFSQLVEKLNPVRDARIPPIVQAMFVLHKPDEKRLTQAFGEHDSILTNVLPVSGQRGATFDLMLSMLDMGQEMVCSWGYSLDVFNKTTIAHLSDAFIAYLHAISSDETHFPLPEKETGIEYIPQNIASANDTPFYSGILDKLAALKETTIITTPTRTYRGDEILKTINAYSWWCHEHLQSQQKRIAFYTPCLIEATCLSIALSQSGRTFVFLMSLEISIAETKTLRAAGVDLILAHTETVFSQTVVENSEHVSSFRLPSEEEISVYENSYFPGERKILAEPITFDLGPANATPQTNTAIKHVIDVFLHALKDLSSEHSVGCWRTQEHPLLSLFQCYASLTLGIPVNVCEKNVTPTEGWCIVSQRELAHWLEAHRLDTKTLPAELQLLIAGEAAYIQSLLLRYQRQCPDYFIPCRGITLTISDLRYSWFFDLQREASHYAQIAPPFHSRFTVSNAEGKPLAFSLRGYLSLNGSPAQAAFNLSAIRRNKHTIDLIPSQQRVSLNGFTYSIDDLGFALSQHPAVIDVAARAVEGDTHATDGWIAWVSLDHTMTSEALFQSLKQYLRTELLPSAITLVSCIPRCMDGSVDYVRLQQMCSVSASSLQILENRLRSLPGTKDVALGLLPNKPAISRWHLRRFNNPQAQFFTPCAETAVTLETSTLASATCPSILDAPPLAKTEISFDSLPGMLRAIANHAPEQTLTFYAAENSEPPTRLTYAELLKRAQCMASGLARHVAAGETVLIVADNNEYFLTLFWGAQLGGYTPVLSVVSSNLEDPSQRAKLENALLSSRPLAIFCTDSLTQGVKEILHTLQDRIGAENNPLIHPYSSLVNFSSIDTNADIGKPPHQTEYSANRHALLLLTSGSTGLPKVVPHTHHALLYASEAIAQRLEINDHDAVFNWMPLDHVGSLVMMHLAAMIRGIRQGFAITEHLLASPLSWIDNLSNESYSITWAPNFAFGLVNDAINNNAQSAWQLNHVRHIINGAEAVLPHTCREFMQHLTPSGLHRHAIVPAWGMSETCSGMVYNTRYDPVTDSKMSVGTPVAGFRLRIVDNDSRVVPAGTPGRLQVQGPTVLSRYGYVDERSQNAFDNNWFNCGDYAIVQDGQLGITGRDESSLVINGKNFTSQHIEAEVETIPGVRPSFTAAVAVRLQESNTEALVLFFVPESAMGLIHAENIKLAVLIKKIRQQLAQIQGITASHIIPVTADEIPKTGIGKILRRQLRQRLIDGDFETALQTTDQLLASDETAPEWFYAPDWQAIQIPARTSSVVLLPVSMTDIASLSEIVQTQLDPIRRHANQENQQTLRCVIDCTHDIDASTPSQSFDHIEQTLLIIHKLMGEIQALHGTSTAPIEFVLLLSLTKTCLQPTHRQRLFEALPALTSSIMRETSHLKIGCISHDNESSITLRKLLNHSNLYPEIRVENNIIYQPVLKSSPTKDIVSDRDSLKASLKDNDLVVVTGANGGIAQVLIAFLQEHYKARVIGIGRSTGTNEILAKQLNHSEIPGYYVQADITDEGFLHHALSRAKAQLNFAVDAPIAAVFHLAGTLREGAFADLSNSQFAASIAAKFQGSINLHAYLQQQSSPSLLVHFSSVNGVNGGAGVAAYGYANRLQLALAANAPQKTGHVRSIWIGWSQWFSIGMSQHQSDEQRRLSRQAGYYTLTPKHALASLEAALNMQHPAILIGIDGTTPIVSAKVTEHCFERERLQVFCTLKPSAPIENWQAQLERLTLADKHSKRILLLAHCVECIPRASDNTVDWAALMQDPTLVSLQRQKIAPRNDTETQLQRIWQQVLGGESPGIHDNFFELGGHSLSATQVMARIREYWGLSLPVSVLFANATIAGLSALLQNTGSQQAQVQIPTLPRAPANEISRLPVSVAQQRMLFLQILEGPSATFNTPFALQIDGELNINLLERAFNDIVARQEVLRSRFDLSSGDAVIEILPELTVNVPFDDLSHYDVATAHRLIMEHFERDARTPFMLDQAPLFRLHAFRVAPQRHVLISNTHHIISDGWSVGVFVKELTLHYAQYRTGATIPLPVLATQYADFAAWQKQWLQSDVIARQLLYWQHQLQGLPPLLDIKTDFPRPPIVRYQGSEEHFIMPTALLTAMEDFCRRHDVTLYMLLLAAWSILLQRYSRQNDIAIGTPVANRFPASTEPLIGLFVNTLVMRNQVEEQTSFIDFLQTVKHTALAAFEHQDAPFDQVVSTVQPARSLSHAPLFQVMFILQNAPIGDLDALGLRISRIERKSSIAKYDLTLQLLQTHGELQGSLEYNTDLFRADSVQRMAQQLQNLLHSAIQTPNQSIASLNMLNAIGREQMLTHWNCTQRDFDVKYRLMQRISDQANQHGDHIAIEFEEERLTYSQLIKRVTTLSNSLVEQDVIGGDTVAVALPRTPDLIIAMLAVVHCGAAYIPVDPEYPLARVQYMLSHSRSRLVICTLAIRDQLELSASQCLCIDNNDSIALPHQTLSTHCATTQRDAENLAYVIYTSGSTGQPKGVKIHHDALLNLLLHFGEQLSIQSSQRWLAVTSVSFDIAALEIFLPLISGATIVLATRENAMDGQWLAKQLKNGDIDILQATPATWQLLTAIDWSGHKKLIALCGGEALTQSLARQLIPRVGRLLNVYGPTETTIWSLAHEVSEVNGVTAPIGRPIANTLVYVLDTLLNPVPPGVPGELHIGGLGVGKGYLFSEALSNERFIDNPFRNAPIPTSTKLYKTGDWVRYLSDGTLEFLSRIDHQVKMRGFRVELGEVESALLNINGIREAVAIVRQQSKDGAAILVAYIITDPTLSLDVKTIKRNLAEQLPHYMVPSTVISMDRFPLTPNGKIDRRSLPEPQSKSSSEGHPFVGARDVIELKLLQLWESLLGVRPISVTDNFFELGGHSILAMRLIAQVQHLFGKHIPPSALLQASTVETLANYVRREVTVGQRNEGPLLCIKPGQPGVTPLILVHPVGGSVFCYHELANLLHPALPVYGLQLPLNEQGQPVACQVPEMAALYLQSLRNTFQDAPLILAGWSLGGIIAYEIARHMEREQRHPHHLILIDSAAPDSYQHYDFLEEINLLVMMALELGLNMAQLALPRILNVSQQEGLDYLLELSKSNGLLPETFTATHLKDRHQLMNTNQESQKAYRDQIGAYGGGMTVLRAEGHPSLREEREYLGWKRHAPQCTAQVIPGDHFTLIRRPHVQALAETLTRTIASAVPAETTPSWSSTHDR